jgi:uncharacterized protein
MNYRQLGRTGLQVSEVGLGGEHLAGIGEEEIRRAVDTALEMGINILDVFMPEPEVRSALGNALAGKREKMLLQGHIGAICENGQYARSRDLGKSIAHIEDFLTRFHTDYIDIGMLHYVDTAEDWQQARDNGFIDYMLRQKKAGVFRTLGVSSHNPVVAREILMSGVMDVLMFSISPLFDLVLGDMDVFFEMPEDAAFPRKLEIDPERAALYQLCEEKGIGITVMKALAAGYLLDAKESPFGAALSVPQCIHYALGRPAAASVLVGCKNTGEVIEAVRYCDMPEAEKEYSHILSNLNGTGAKRCMYCNHCLPCPRHIDIAAVTRLLDDARPGLTDDIRMQYSALEKNASDCTACGACVSRCPFGIDVVENMKKAAGLF